MLPPVPLRLGLPMVHELVRSRQSGWADRRLFDLLHRSQMEMPCDSRVRAVYGPSCQQVWRLVCPPGHVHNKPWCMLHRVSIDHAISSCGPAWHSYTAPFNNNRTPGQRDYHGSLRSDCTCFLRWGSIMNPAQLEILTIGNKPGIQQLSSCQVMRPAKTG